MADPEKCMNEKVKFVEQDGELDYYSMDNWDVLQDGMFFLNMIDRYEKQGNRKPFYIFIADAQNVPCTVKSRIWKTQKGNIHFIVCVPKEKFKDKMFDCAPLTVPLSVIDYLNSITDDPECYRLKFSNDVLCDHMKKNGGIMCKDKKDYFISLCGLNVHFSPPKEQLRKEGILACSLDKHCTKVDLNDPEKLTREVSRKEYEGLMKYNHPQEVCDKFNEYLYVFDKQKRTVYRYNEKEGNYTVTRDDKEILVDAADGSFYDPDEVKSVVHKYDYFEPELCNGEEN